MESYMGEQRTRYSAAKVQARAGNQGKRLLVNENKSLIERLDVYTDLPSKSQQQLGGYDAD